MHRHPTPRRSQIHWLALVGDGEPAQYRLRHLSNQVFGQRHHVVVVGVGLVNLDRRKFGVVAGGNAFVAEDPPQFKHLLKATNNQPLQV